MSNIQSFDILDDGSEVCPRVCDFPSITEDRIVGGNLLVTSLETIKIQFDYPLSQAATLEFHNPGGFTRMDFFRSVYEGYSRIYCEEDNSTMGCDSDNSVKCCGPHGIWGHDIEDLFLEGFREISSGLFDLGIGS